MKIYNSTESIKYPKVGDLKLKVNSMWDFCARDVCYQTIDSTFGGGKTTIAYNLEECIEVKDSYVIGSNPPKPRKQTKWKDAEITPKIVEELKQKGMTLLKDFLPRTDITSDKTDV